jgi:hypothetical protein
MHGGSKRKSKAESTTVWWFRLGKKEDDLFQNAARLEVSGIRRGPALVSARVRAKLKQTSQSDATGLPAIVVVVEFGTPVAEIGQK